MASIFISYSRSDKAFVQTLTAALRAAKRDYWLDENDIPPSATWRAEIERNIALADTFLYVLSPDSIAATSGCAAEVKDALRDAKRIVPLVCREVESKQVLPEVAALNWIFCRPSDDFAAAFAKLLEAFDTDLDYWHQAAQYLVRAHQWETKHENASFALRGRDLTEAETWLAKGVAKKPAPTPLHVRYITASRRVAHRQQRRTISFLSVVSVLMAGLAVAALLFFNQARLQRDNAIFGEVLASSTAQLDTDPDLALLDAVEATRLRNTPDSRTALYTALEHFPYLAAVLQNGKAQTDFQGITNVAFSADGQTLLTADTKDIGGPHKTQVTMWDVSTGQYRTRFTIPHDIEAAVLSPDGRLVATGARFTGGSLELWNATTGTRITELSGDHPLGSSSLAFSPDGSLLASVLGNGDITLWNVASQAPKIQFSVDDRIGNPIELAFSPDGKSLALNTCAADSCEINHFLLWNIAAARVTLSYSGVFKAFSFSANGKVLALGGCATLDRCPIEGQTLLFDLTRGTPIGAPFTDSAGMAYRVALSPDGHTLVTVTGDHATLRLWNVPARTSTELTGHTDTVSDLAFSPDGRHFATGDLGNKVLLWHATPFTALSRLPSADFDGTSTAAFSPDGKTLATASCQQITLWNTATGVPAATIAIGSRGAGSAACGDYLAFSPDGKRLAVITPDSFFLVNLTTRQRIFFTVNGTKPIIEGTYVGSYVAFSPDGRFLVTNDGGDFDVWDTTGGTLLQNFGGGRLQSSNSAPAFNPDGTLLALGQSGNDVALVNGHDFSPIATLHGPTAPAYYVVQVAFSPDGKTLAALSVGGAITLWQVQTRTLIGSFQALTTSNTLSNCLAFSPDNHMVAACLGMTFGMWYVATREPVIAPQRADTYVPNLTFSPDGRLLAETTLNGPLFVRYATLPLWQAQACAIADRNFTRTEWRQIFDTEPYQQVCPNLPVPPAS